MWGKNNINSAAEIATLRSMYQAKAHPENGGQGSKVIKDLNFAEFNYYGRINTNGVVVQPKDTAMTTMQTAPASDSSSQFQILPLVNEMYNEMRMNISLKIMSGVLSPATRSIALLEPVRAWENPTFKYIDYLRGILMRFNTDYLSDSDIKKITSFDMYVKYLMVYFREQNPGDPITYTGWYTSKYNSIFSTGLAFAIENFKGGNDEQSVNFINSPAYPYYKKIALNKGFSIIKQAPWVLVADLSSPAASKFFPGDKTATRNILGLFSQNYYRTDVNDINLLINYIIKYYNDFVIFNEEKRTISVSCNNKTRVNTFRRQLLDEYNTNYRFSRHWVSIYAELRNIENNNEFTKPVLRQIITNSNKFLDKAGKAGYINDIFRNKLFSKPFGLSGWTKRLERRRVLLSDVPNQPSTTNKKSGGSGGGY